MAMPRLKSTQTQKTAAIGGPGLDPGAFAQTGLEQVGTMMSKIASSFRDAQIKDTLDKESINLQKDMMFFNESLKGENDPNKHAEMFELTKKDLEEKYKNKINDSTIFENFRNTLDGAFLNAEAATLDQMRVKMIENFQAGIGEKREALEDIAASLTTPADLANEAISRFNNSVNNASGQGEEGLPSYINKDDAAQVKAQGVNQIYNAYCGNAVERDASGLLADLESKTKDNFPGMTQETRSTWIRAANQQVDTDVISLEVGKLRKQYGDDFFGMQKALWENTTLDAQQMQKGSSILNTEHQLFEQNKKHEIELLQLEGFDEIHKAHVTGTQTVTEMMQNIDNNDSFTEEQKTKKKKAVATARWDTNKDIYADLATKINSGTISGNQAILEIEQDRGFGLSNEDADKLITKANTIGNKAQTHGYYYQRAVDLFDTVYGKDGFRPNTETYTHKPDYELTLDYWMSEENIDGAELFLKAKEWLKNMEGTDVDWVPFNEKTEFQLDTKEDIFPFQKEFEGEERKEQVKEKVIDVTQFPEYQEAAVTSAESVLKNANQPITKANMDYVLKQMGTKTPGE